MVADLTNSTPVVVLVGNCRRLEELQTYREKIKNLVDTPRVAEEEAATSSTQPKIYPVYSSKLPIAPIGLLN
ncbi:hypothetical protein AND_008890 [Anopheles darlingi]|uniref:Uncharacterized protein n=1 Tax=Anopheles darlingi TaxID=43151 RepID=W5J4V8_ANODA|nr:hypothetical protein AND_008890 [Anopheles darlingi]